jgi:repressor LexA
MNYSVLERLMAARGISAYRLSRDTGISPSSLSDWKRGRSAPKADKLSIIADYFGVSLDSLMGTERVASHTAALSEYLVPVIGSIRAGLPIITEEELQGFELADLGGASPDDYFFLRINGDSMKNIGMINGSLVLFRKQQYAEEGQVVACLVGGESATVNRFSKRGRRIFLLPENPAYSPIELSPADFETGEARILGVAEEIKIKL